MVRLPPRVGGLLAVLGIGIAAAGCGSAIPSKAGADGVKAMSSEYGTSLVDAQGHALYVFERDDKGESYCNGACAAVWPPFTADRLPTAMSGVSASALGRIKREDGEMQVTYHGHPLYYYAADASTPGRTRGEDVNQFGSTWYLVGRNGKSVEPKESSGSKAPTNTTNTNSGGGGY